MLQPIEVSVVIPTRNRPKLLRRSVESALRQERVTLEVVVVIDGADAVSVEVLQSFDDPRVRWVLLPQSVGGGEARNVGARYARGCFIALLDDDDEWLAGKLEKQLAMARGHGGDVFAVTTQYLYRKDGNADEVWPGHLPRNDEDLSEFLFSSAGGFQTSTYLCPRSLFLKVPFERGLKRHQDWDWFLKLKELSDFKLLVVEEALSVYWVPEGRKSISGDGDWKFSLEWADRVRHRMTPSAYAAFVVRICLRGAILQSESAITVLKLLCQLLRSGGMTFELTIHVLGSILMSEETRQKIRAWKLRFEGRGQTLRLQEGR